MKPTFTCVIDKRPGQPALMVVTCLRCDKEEGRYTRHEALMHMLSGHRYLCEHCDAYNVPAARCPACKYKMDTAASISEDGSQPSPGDLSMCLMCGEPLEFTEDLALVRAGADAMEGLEPAERARMELLQRKIKEQRRARAHLS